MFQVLVFPLALPLHGLKWSGVLITDSVGFRLNVHIPINIGVFGRGGGAKGEVRLWGFRVSVSFLPLFLSPGIVLVRYSLGPVLSRRLCFFGVCSQLSRKCLSLICVKVISLTGSGGSIWVLESCLFKVFPCISPLLVVKREWGL